MSDREKAENFLRKTLDELGDPRLQGFTGDFLEGYFGAASPTVGMLYKSNLVDYLLEPYN